MIKSLLFVLAMSFVLISESFSQTNKIQEVGNVGIGTTTPSAPLEVAGSYNDFTLARNAIVLRNNGTGNLSSSLAFVGNNTLHWEMANDYYANGSNNFYIASCAPAFKVPFFINESGYVGIGTINPDQELTVNGMIHTKEIKVDLNVTAPDYVFNPEYKPAALSEVENFVKQNHHLPEIPSAIQMEKEGINLGEMNVKLLKKVEELTLYLIEQNKRNQKQQEQINQLEKQVIALKKIMTGSN